MKLLCKMAGGSHAYGLETPTSDYDERYVYIHDTIENIIGLDKNEFIDRRNNSEDSFGFELRHFMLNLRKTNTQILEILFTDKKKFIEVHPMFVDKIQANKTKLIDPIQFYKSLKGYIQGEKRLANGERIGKLGGKRREALDQFGYSPKNFVQLFRLAYCGESFFKFGNFPVNIREVNVALADWLMEIKTKPQLFAKETLNKLVDTYEKALDDAYINSKQFDIYSFDKNVASQILFDFYYPILGRLYSEKLAL